MALSVCFIQRWCFGDFLDSTLADALGLTRQPEEEDAREYSPAEIRRMERRRLVFQRCIRGESYREICKFLEQNGYPSSLQTVFNDLHSDQMQGFVEELERVQLQDIALLRGLSLEQKDLKGLSAALQARSQMLRYLMPQPEKSRVNVEVNVNQQSKTTITAELLAKYEQLVKTGTADTASPMGHIPADNSVQPVDSSKTNGKANAVST